MAAIRTLASLGCDHLPFKLHGATNRSLLAGPLLSFVDAHDASEASVVEDLDLVEGISFFFLLMSQLHTAVHRVPLHCTLIS